MAQRRPAPDNGLEVRFYSPIRKRGVAGRRIAGIGAGPHGGGAGDFAGDWVCLHRIAATDFAFD